MNYKVGQELVDEACVPLLESMCGKAVSGIRRVHWSYQDRLDLDFGWIELAMGDDVVLFNEAPDWTCLRAVIGLYEDDWERSLSTEDLEFRNQHGGLRAIDVGSTEPYSAIVGHQIAGIDPIRDDVGNIIGFDLITDAAEIRARVAYDEFSVTARLRP